MTRRRPWGWLILALVAPLVLQACGGKKRPPAVATGGGTSPYGREAPLPVDSGPDIQPIGNDNTTGSEFAASDPVTGEGGPLEDIHFPFDQASLTDEARGTLEKHALWLQNHREAKVVVEGHCDERGTAEYNLALGDKRARAARDYLLSLGVAADRLTGVSYGKEKPLDPASNEEAWTKNRRAHFSVSR
jgi:peptidoglycan-associated lipoprotein